MKKAIAVIAVLFALAWMVRISSVHAQTTQPGVSLITVTTAAGCPTPTNLSITGTVWQLCGAPDGVYVSVVNTPTPTKLGAPTTAGVTTLNGKSGALTVTITPGSITSVPDSYTPPTVSVQ